jgi:hypothetical protein
MIRENPIWALRLRCKAATAIASHRSCTIEKAARNPQRRPSCMTLGQPKHHGGGAFTFKLGVGGGG